MFHMLLTSFACFVCDTISFSWKLNGENWTFSSCDRQLLKVTKSICGIADSGLKLFAKVSVSEYARHDIIVSFKFINSFLNEDFAINEFTKRVLKE